MSWIALRMLMGDRAKYFGIVLGVMLSALLISHQVTIFVGLMSRTRSIFQTLPHADLILSSPSTEFVEDVHALSDLDVDRVRGVKGIEWAVPMLRTNIKARLDGGKSRTVVLVGLDDATLIGGPMKMAQGAIRDLRQVDGVIVDRLDALKLLSVKRADGTLRVPGIGDEIELNDRRARIVGISENPRPFLSQPIIYTTMSRARAFAPKERRQVSFVLAKLTPGAAFDDVKTNVREGTGLETNTRLSFGWKTIHYFLTNTGIPVNFGVTVLLGCIVGAAIAGQTFYLFILDNIRQLGALKAMGASHPQLVRMVAVQAGVVGMLGYGIGIGLTALFFVLFIGTDLDFQLHWEVLAMTAGIIVVIITGVGGVSLLKVIRLEPAVVFRG